MDETREEKQVPTFILDPFTNLAFSFHVHVSLLVLAPFRGKSCCCLSDILVARRCFVPFYILSLAFFAWVGAIWLFHFYFFFLSFFFFSNV